MMNDFSSNKSCVVFFFFLQAYTVNWVHGRRQLVLLVGLVLVNIDFYYFIPEEHSPESSSPSSGEVIVVIVRL